jgi:hypothetical protein
MPSPSSSSNTLAQVIQVHPLAAAKPPVGAPCNGCGLCCLAETCPVGIVLSRSRSGPCKALRWDAAEHQYRCGALGTGLQARVIGRWIAAGAGCDCDLEATPGVTIETPTCDTRHD